MTRRRKPSRERQPKKATKSAGVARRAGRQKATRPWAETPCGAFWTSMFGCGISFQMDRSVPNAEKCFRKKRRLSSSRPRTGFLATSRPFWSRSLFGAPGPLFSRRATERAAIETAMTIFLFAFCGQQRRGRPRRRRKSPKACPRTPLSDHRSPSLAPRRVQETGFDPKGRNDEKSPSDEGLLVIGVVANAGRSAKGKAIKPERSTRSLDALRFRRQLLRAVPAVDHDIAAAVRRSVASLVEHPGRAVFFERAVQNSVGVDEAVEFLVDAHAALAVRHAQAAFQIGRIRRVHLQADFRRVQFPHPP